MFILEFWEFLELKQSHEELCSGIFEIGGCLACFGREPLQNVLKTTTKGRSLGGVPYTCIYVYTYY